MLVRSFNEWQSPLVMPPWRHTPHLSLREAKRRSNLPPGVQRARRAGVCSSLTGREIAASLRSSQ
jgi:hypothetical protein